MEIDFETIEKACKLMEKYKMQELTLADGTKLVKTLHLPPKTRAPRKSKKINQPVNGTDIPDELLFAATKAKPLTDFNRFSVSKVLPKALEGNS